MRNNNKSKIPSFLLGLSFTPDVSSGSYQGLSCSKTGSPTGSQLPSVHSHSVGSSMGCWGTSAVAPGASSPHPLHWSWCLQGCFSLVFTPLPMQLCMVYFYPFMNCSHNSLSVWGAQLWPVVGPLGADWTGSVRCGKSWDFLTQATLAASVLSKPYQINQRQWTRIKIGKKRT